MNRHDVNGLPLPQQLVDLLRARRWVHPGDDALSRLVPFLRDPVDFLQTIDRMRSESPARHAGDRQLDHIFHFVRGSMGNADLPWLDVDRTVFVAVNRNSGDDVAIALDYRTDVVDPRVVASDWDDRQGSCEWREVAPTFSAFLAKLQS